MADAPFIINIEHDEVAEKVTAYINEKVHELEQRWAGLSERDIDALVRVGRMYLNALDADPEFEMLSATEALMVTEVREAVEKWEQR